MNLPILFTPMSTPPLSAPMSVPTALPGLGLPGSSFWPPGCVGADMQPGGRTWELLSRCGCSLLGCLGLTLLIVCSYDFFGPLKTHGQVGWGVPVGGGTCVGQKTGGEGAVSIQVAGRHAGPQGPHGYSQ